MKCDYCGRHGDSTECRGCGAPLPDYSSGEWVCIEVDQDIEKRMVRIPRAMSYIDISPGWLHEIALAQTIPGPVGAIAGILAYVASWR